jgi:hypothetical protein
VCWQRIPLWKRRAYVDCRRMADDGVADAQRIWPAALRQAIREAQGT